MSKSSSQLGTSSAQLGNFELGAINPPQELAAVIIGASTLTAAMVANRALNIPGDPLIGQLGTRYSRLGNFELGKVIPIVDPGTIVGQSALNAGMIITRVLNATIAPSGNVDAALGLRVALAATIAAQSVLSAGMKSTYALEAVIQAQAAIESALNVLTQQRLFLVPKPSASIEPANRGSATLTPAGRPSGRIMDA